MSRREELSVNTLITPTGARRSYGTAAPTAGKWGVGDTVINTVPTAGGVYCWVCVTAGTPGTWKSVAIAA
jgi:hypothetical protein